MGVCTNNTTNLEFYYMDNRTQMKIRLAYQARMLEELIQK
jgi:hypothetical protein